MRGTNGQIDMPGYTGLGPSPDTGIVIGRLPDSAPASHGDDVRIAFSHYGHAGFFISDDGNFSVPLEGTSDVVGGMYYLRAWNAASSDFQSGAQPTSATHIGYSGLVQNRRIGSPGMRRPIPDDVLSFGVFSTNIPFPQRPVGNASKLRRLANGDYEVAFDGTPGVQYTVEWTQSISTTPINWQNLGDATAEQNGIGTIIHPNPPHQTIYYRAFLP